MYQLAAFDMDGTLLGPDHLVAPETLSTLQRLADSGVKLVFATGRHHLEVQMILKRLGLQGYIIGGNGTRTLDYQGNHLDSVDLPEDVATETLSDRWQTRAKSHAFCDEGWIVEFAQPEVLIPHQFSGFHYQIMKFSDLAGQGISKVCFSSDYDELTKLEQRLIAHFGERADLCFSSSTFLEVLPRHCNKGTALTKLCESIDIPLSRCIAFGDAMNDKEMLESVGKGCVMGNALPRLKESLPHLEVIGSCSEQGVARYLQRLFL